MCASELRLHGSSWKSLFHSRGKRILQIVCLLCTFKSVHKRLEWGMQVQTPNNSFWKTRPASIGGLPPGQNSSWSTLSRVSEPFFCISRAMCFIFHHLVTPNSQVLRCRWSNWRPRAKNLEETQPTESSFTDRGIHDGNFLSMYGSMHFQTYFWMKGFVTICWFDEFDSLKFRKDDPGVWQTTFQTHGRLVESWVTLGCLPLCQWRRTSILM